VVITLNRLKPTSKKTESLSYISMFRLIYNLTHRRMFTSMNGW